MQETCKKHGRIIITYGCHVYYIFIFYYVGDEEIIKQGFLNTNEMIKLLRMTFYKSESGLETIL